MPCVPVAGIQNGMFALPMIGSGVWVEFEQGDPDYPIWVGCFWGSAAEVPALARATPPGVQAITLQTPLQNGITVSDLPGPTGGIMLKSATGATLIVNDTGIYIQNGKGAIDHDDRPDGHRQHRRADGGLGARCPGPCFISAPRCSAATAGRRCRRAPNPRVLVSGQPTVDDGRAVHGRRLRFVHAGGGNGAVRHRRSGWSRRRACSSTASRSC